MTQYKTDILNNICYTDLVYGRINKKLSINLSNDEVEKFVLMIIKESDEKDFIKKGKNIYVHHYQKKVRLTINSYNFRIITADILNS
ncbi:DUF3781 domain-containing protein [Flammeovirga yaeyamensis]|uniref:DUF3781 domain-containing protein n=1 Tax=Flammeovirga yaeyamensis TaxID=367791 RepID=A0AAX1NA55_9BACT|nr:MULTISPECIES: DUF3781 domain-containing protein [Flammeovirga]ANQ52208.1 DUF3781 domain-containing protein [Flammeovirga sp. MY04]MBB3699160.1 hypothetical protein [Flammeovirga yaeyamensis]NMF35576.1 DUF3781 domain-containing protein [Flammeovirga yaeyamensis]QWG04434.1 DUF3781 domain-containing protein [Flammeovirga yaeyamensis]